jgi:hypothetical protein
MGLIALQRSLRLVNQRLIRSRINLGEQLALFD